MKYSFVYILTNDFGNVMYVGVTSNLERRLWQHKNGSISGFTKDYHVHKLVYYECFADIRYAIEREKQIKGWRRSKKDELVEKVNPTRRDLSEDWYKNPNQ